MRVDPRTSMYDYETPDQFMAIIFCKILDAKGIMYKEEIVSNVIGPSYVKFWCTPRDRILVEYIYRRCLRLDRLYLINLSGYQKNAYKLRRDKYAIY